MTDTILSSSRRAMQGEEENGQLFLLKMRWPSPSPRVVLLFPEVLVSTACEQQREKC